MPDRRVRHLRLAARAEAEVRRLLPRLEDALRCANLPDSGEQLFLVRRLALGRLPHDASPQTLALLIERRVVAIGGPWAEGGSPAAETATFIRFASRFDARAELALRLALGRPATAWYWPRAVPEYRPEACCADNLRRIALALAELPEARAALPAWTARLLEAGAGEPLLAAIPPGLGERLIRRIDLPVVLVPGAATAVPPAAATPPGTQPEAQPDWLVRMLAAARPAAFQRRPAHPPATARIALVTPTVPATATQGAMAAARRPPTAPSHPGREALPPRANAPGPGQSFADPADSGHRNATRSAPAQARHPGVREGTTAGTGLETRPAPLQPQRKSVRSDATRAAAAGTDSQPWQAATTGGGLLFLLPLLARLGVAAWSEQPGREDFPQRVLALAARRLRLSADDPVWALLETAPGNPRRRPPPAPVLWAASLLAAPHARRGTADLVSALAAAGTLDAQATVCLTAARRWLRRAARLGLADLVLRPARIGLTATHVDMHFRLADCDIRVRRAGLDLDPGWLAWFGRVVSFHYDVVEAA